MAIIGDILAARYELRAILGRGTSGVVYRAHDHELGDELALKILHPQYSGQREFRERFRNELLAARSVTHPHVLKVFNFFAQRNEPWFFTMELLSGGSVREALSTHRGQGLDTQRTVRFLAQTLSALTVLHRANIVHRDIKPENLLLAADDWVKLSDFSVACGAATAADLTQTGETVGTPIYMSPEQCRGEPVDERSDLYSLGIVAFELLTGAPPFAGAHFMELAEQHHSAPLPVSQLPPETPEWISSFLLRLTEKAPKNRFASAAEALDQLQQNGGTPAAEFSVPAHRTAGDLNRELRERRRQRFRLFAWASAAVVFWGSTSLIVARYNADVAIPVLAAAIALDGQCVSRTPCFEATCGRILDTMKRALRLPLGRDYLSMVKNGAVPAPRVNSIVRALAWSHTALDAADADGETLLSLAIRHGLSKAALELAAAGASLTRVQLVDHMNVLHLLTVANTEPRLVRAFLELPVAKGLDFDTGDASGFTPLFSAILEQNVALVRIFLEHGMRVNVVDHVQQTPLIAAASLASPYGERIVALLLTRPELDPSPRDSTGINALFHAVLIGQQEVLTLMACDPMRRNFDPNVILENSSRPLFSAIQAHDRLMVQTLRYMGATTPPWFPLWAEPTPEEREWLQSEPPPPICHPTTGLSS